MTERPGGTTARSRWHRFAASSAAAFAMLLGLACAAPVHASVDEAAADPELTLTSSARGVLRPGAALSATLTVQSPSDTAAEGGTAVLRLGERPLGTRDALRTWLGGSDEGVALRPIGTATVADVPAGQSDATSISVPASGDAIADLPAGVYPLRAELGDAHADTVVVVSDELARVGIVVPITAPAITTGVLSAEQLSDLTAPDGALTAQLEAVAGTEAVLAIDPAIPAAIRALGTTAPASAVAWLDRLMLLRNDRFALQFGDADVSAPLQAGLAAPPQPGSLDAYVVAEPQPEPSPTPTPSVASTADEEADDAASDLDELLDIGDAHDALYWPVPGSAGPDVIRALRGVDEAAVTLVPSDATAEGAEGAAVPARGDGVLVYDAAASAALDGIARESDEVARGEATAAASAELWFAAREAGREGAPLLVALDRGVAEPAAASAEDDDATDTGDDAQARLSAAIDAIAASPLTAPARLDDLLDAPAEPVTVADAQPNAARTAFVAETVDVEQRVATTATVLEDPAVLTGQMRAETLQLLSVGWDGRRSAWEDAVGTYRERARARADAVAIQPPTTVQLISAGADLPVWIRNNLPYPVTVTLVAHPDDPRLDVTELTTVVAQPSSNTSVQVPVEARVGSGDVSIDLTLLSPTGELIGAPQTVEVTVRADWERIGIVLLAVLIVGLVGTGIVRTIRRRRRAARAAGGRDADEHAAAEHDAGEQAGNEKTHA